MKLGIVIGSIREGRITDRLAKWVDNEAKAMEGVTTQIIDLKELAMRQFDEAANPRFTQDRHPEKNVKIWLDLVAGCDALVLVTPEYNRSYSSALKSAIDYLDYQIERKPVMLVAHGSSGGAQAVSHLRAVLPGVGSMTTPYAVMVVGRISELFDENGQPSEVVKSNPYGPVAALKKALDDLKWYSDALAKARG